MPLVRWLVWALGVAALAGIIHIATILSIPQIAPYDAWSRITAIVPEGGKMTLPRATPGNEALPFMDPAVIYTVCRYNLANGPLRVDTRIPDTFWSVAGHTRAGIVYYSVTSQAAPRGEIVIEIRDNAQMKEVELKEAEATNDVLNIEAPEDEGFLLFRSLVATESQAPAIAKLARSSTCETLPPSE